VRKSRYSDEQIASALRQAEIGTPVAEITRKLRQLRDENAKLKAVVADLTLDSPRRPETAGIIRRRLRIGWSYGESRLRQSHRGHRRKSLARGAPEIMLSLDFLQYMEDNNLDDA